MTHQNDTGTILVTLALDTGFDRPTPWREGTQNRLIWGLAELMNVTSNQQVELTWQQY